MGGDTESLLQIQAQSQFLFTYLKAKTLVKTGKKGVKADGGGLAMSKFNAEISPRKRKASYVKEAKTARNGRRRRKKSHKKSPIT